jgi:tRNA G18 (ribose-2'-O)-methylase SpoU
MKSQGLLTFQLKDRTEDIKEIMGKKRYRDFPILNKEEKYAIILGNEVKGVQQEVVDLCDETVEIPQFGTKHSLNVSVAGALTIWNIFSQLKLQ